jgi:dihydroneopterin aldolase
MTQPTQHASLALHQLALDVYLGWPDEECQHKQTVEVDIKIEFLQLPQACVSDHLQDTFSYDHVIAKIIETTSTPKYRLLEHLGHEIYLLVKSLLTPATKISVRVKKYPAIAALKGGASFTIGD